MKDLDFFFNPKTIALIGATDRPQSVGLGICRNLLEGEGLPAQAGERSIFFVNPNAVEVLGKKTFSKITDIQEEIDLAIIAVPAPIVFQVAKDCVKKRIKGAIIISSGFAEIGREGEKRQEEILKVFKKAGIRLLGPNCLGIIRPSVGLNASFAPATPKNGGIAFLSQSGALIDSMIDKSLSEDFGFSNLISFGNEADVNICEILEFLENDAETKIIAFYLEGLKAGSGKRFMEICKKVSKNKPIIVLKGGKTESGKKLAFSHTAVLAGEEDIYSAGFKKAGIFEVETINELFKISLALTNDYFLQAFRAGLISEKIGIITNGGAVGILTADWCAKMDITAKDYSDILGDALSSDYEKALRQMLSKKEIGAVIICQAVQVMTEIRKNAEVVVELQKEFPKKPIICLFLGGEYAEEGIKILKDNSIACFSEPKEAVLGIKALISGKNLVE